MDEAIFMPLKLSKCIKDEDEDWFKKRRNLNAFSDDEIENNLAPPHKKRRLAKNSSVAQEQANLVLPQAISLLSEDILIYSIFPYLSDKELTVCCSLVSRKWHKAAQHPILWKRNAIARWGPIQRFENGFLSFAKRSKINWQQYFLGRYACEKYYGSSRFNLARTGTLETMGLHFIPNDIVKVITFEALNLHHRLAISLDRKSNSIVFKVQQFHALKKICFLGKMSFDFRHMDPRRALDADDAMQQVQSFGQLEHLDDQVGKSGVSRANSMDSICTPPPTPSSHIADNHLGYSMEWKVKCLADSVPTIVNNLVVIYNMSTNTLSALDIESGESIWSNELTDDVIYNMCDFSVCVVGSCIAIPTQNGLDIFRLSDGEKVGCVRPSTDAIAQLLKGVVSLEDRCPPMDQFVYGSIAMENDVAVWLYERDHIPYLMVAHLSAANQNPSASPSTPSFLGSLNYDQTITGSIIAAHNLQTLCNFDKLNKYCNVSMNEGRVFLNSNSPDRSEGYLYIIEPVSGTVLWSYVSNSPFMSKPLVHHNILIFACVLGIFCLDTAKLELLWHYQLELSEQFLTRVECTGPILTLHDNIVTFVYYEYTPGSSSTAAQTDDELDIDDNMSTGGMAAAEEKMECHITAIHVVNGNKLWSKRLENILISDSVRILDGNIIAPFHSPNGLGGVIWLK